MRCDAVLAVAASAPGAPRPHQHRDWAHPRPHRHQLWAHPCPHLRPCCAHPCPHLHRDRARPAHICAGTDWVLQTADKNLRLKIHTLDSESMKQQELIYNADFSIQARRAPGRAPRQHGGGFGAHGAAQYVPATTLGAAAAAGARAEGVARVGAAVGGREEGTPRPSPPTRPTPPLPPPSPYVPHPSPVPPQTTTLTLTPRHSRR